MSSNRPAVSVLMPVFNAEHYLGAAVESILDQSFVDFEFVIVDDGSTDNSLAILQEYAGNDERIRLVSRPNTGLVPALNEMLAMSRSPLIARMDADDIAYPERLELQVAHLSDRPQVLCIGGAVELIDKVGRVLQCPRPVCGNDLVQREALQGRTPICHPAAMFRREAVLALGSYRQEAYPAEDLDLWLRLGEIGELDNISECVLKYRLHSNSISERHSDAQLAKMRAVCAAAWKRRRFAGTFCNGLVASKHCSTNLNGGIKNPFARAIVLASENASPVSVCPAAANFLEARRQGASAQ